jgi:ADP-heptose:LPS heptosyltransferase
MESGGGLWILVVKRINMEQERIKNPVMEFYRHVYRYSKRWDGKESLEGKVVCVYCEQGYGDIIQFLRYLKPLKERGCKVIVAAPEALHPLLYSIEGVDDFYDKQCSVLPKHDLHILSLSLPFLLDVKEIPSSPYVKYNKQADLEEYSKGTKIGIAWEGSPEHPKNQDRCCLLKHFKVLLEKDVTLFMLQNKVYISDLVKEVDFPIYSIPINNFGDTASLINAVDFVVTVDTSILHLAGAMGKRTYGILGVDADPRWSVGKWYDTVTLLQGNWEDTLNIVRFCRNK